jgi:hypothetical protein
MRNNDSKGLIAQAVDDDCGGLLAGCVEFCRLRKGTGGGSSTPVREERGGNSSGSIVYPMPLSSRTASMRQSHRPKSEVLLPSNFGRKSLKSVMAGKSVKNFRSK